MVYDLILGDDHMTIDFHDENNKQSYTTRAADSGWLASIGKIIDPASIGHAVDIRCGAESIPKPWQIWESLQ